jgi:hypothetical protein
MYRLYGCFIFAESLPFLEIFFIYRLYPGCVKESELSIEPLAYVMARKGTHLKIMLNPGRNKSKTHQIVFQPQLSILTESLINKLQSNYSFFMDLARSEIK